MIYLQMIDIEEDKRKFVLLYELYRNLLLHISYDVLNDYQLAEDALHEAFIKIAQNMSKISDVHSLKTKRYLITITKNAAIDIYRQRKARQRMEIYVDELTEEDLPIIYPEPATDGDILDILTNLPAIYRDVFILKYSSLLDNSEIAKLLRISESTVRQRISRGKIIAQNELNKSGGNHRGNKNLDR